MSVSHTFADKVAIITGASSGIGAATAVHFAKLHCRLSLAGRLLENLELTRRKCIEAGLKQTEVLITAGDVTDDAHLTSLVDKTVSTFGRLDVLVNCAGMIKNGNVVQSPLDDFDEIMRVNVRSAIELSKM